MPPRVSLPVLDAEIDARARAIHEALPFWPCKRGCDLCCRSLPHLPTISGPEWARLRAAIQALPEDLIEEVLARTRAAPESGPLTCPLLDGETGACRVYAARPIACRTYGFYAERDAGLHCERVTEAIEDAGVADSVVWGNGEAVAHALDALGERVSLRTWMNELVTRSDR